MTAKQWMWITAVVILNIVILGALVGPPAATVRVTPTSTWTPYPTFTPTPFPTSTAILMPTVPARPTATPTPAVIRHQVSEGETLPEIAEAYGVGLYVLRMVNRIPERGEVRAGQELVIPVIEE